MNAFSILRSKNPPVSSCAICVQLEYGWNRGSKKGLLQFHATRPTLYGLETHLTTSIRLINQCEPKVVILDPINGIHDRREPG